MKNFKLQLLAATAIACGVASTAHAQVALPPVEIDGVGATSIQNILVQSLNCIGNPGGHGSANTDDLNQLGTNTGSLSNVAEGKFVQSNPTTASPDYDCNTQEIQSSFQGKYVATGSGTGRAFWRLFSNQLPGTTPSNQNPFGSWNNVQFAFSDAPAASSDLTAYDANANSSTNHAGAPIQFPLYVLPVSIAYNPVYARYRSATLGLINLSYQLHFPQQINGVDAGGLRLTKNLYCKVFNGDVTNFNDAAFTSANGGQSLKDPNDSQSRWVHQGVPVRLVGRLDNSGTTDVFTRHLAEVCTGQAGVSANKFSKNAEALPYDTSSSIDLRSFRSDTRYFPGSTGALAGTTQSLSGAVFVKAAGSTPAHIDTTQGNEAAGLFMVADGSGAVRDAVNYQPDPATGAGQIVLNGKLAYISADFVVPATGAVLYSSQLQIGTSTKYAMPTLSQVTAAFGGILPPQTVSTSGAFSTADTRTGPARDGSTGSVPIDRANPLHWTSVLYSDASRTLANPTSGYPITGTTQFLGYTCYSTAAKRLGVAEFLYGQTGYLKADSDNNPVSTNLFTGLSTANGLGLIAQLNILPMPLAWQNAIYATFLSKSTQVSGGQTLGAKNLWLQTVQPKTTQASPPANPTCVAGKGA